MAPSTDDLIRELASDLPPVKPLARVRIVVASLLGLSLPVFIWWLTSRGLRHQFEAGEAPTLAYLLATAVMLLLAAGGLLFGLTSVIPGREKEARAGRRLFGAGLGVGVVLFFLYWLSGGSPIVETLASSRSCARGSLLLAIPAGLVVAYYVYRGAARSLPVALAASFTGAAGVSALMVHLTCAHPDPFHMVLGHALAPLYGGVALLGLGSLVVALGIGRRDPS